MRRQRGLQWRGGLMRRVWIATAAMLLTATSAACSPEGQSADNLAVKWQAGDDKSYASADGATVSLPPAKRGKAVEFSGTTDAGEHFSSLDTRGSITVVNFWYAGCAPCRAEAQDLAAAYTEFAPQGVHFIGVNTRDQREQAQQFARQFKVEYPSILDNPGGRLVQQAFAGVIPLDKVPTTLVLDSAGRVQHRIIGQLAGSSQLPTMLKESLAEIAASGG